MWAWRMVIFREQPYYYAWRKINAVSRDWLQQLCLVNIDACKTHVRNIYFLLNYATLLVNNK